MRARSRSTRQRELTQQLHGLAGEVKTLLEEMREERAQMKKMMPEKNAGQIQKHEVVTEEKLGACANTIRICDLEWAGAGYNGHGQNVPFYWVDADWGTNGPKSRCVNLRCNQAQIAGFTNSN